MKPDQPKQYEPNSRIVLAIRAVLAREKVSNSHPAVKNVLANIANNTAEGKRWKMRLPGLFA